MSSILCLFYLMSAAAFLSSLEGQILTTGFRIFSSNIRLEGSLLVKTIPELSLISCAIECARDQTLVAFNYNTVENLCELVSTERNNTLNATLTINANYNYYVNVNLPSCLSNPCLYGSHCVPTEDGMDYRCLDCLPNFGGKNCEVRMEEATFAMVQTTAGMMETTVGMGETTGGQFRVTTDMMAGTTGMVAYTTAYTTAYTIAMAAGTTDMAAGTTGIVAGTTGMVAGTTGMVAGTTGMAAGTTGMVAGTTGMAAGTTGMAAGTTDMAAGTTDVTENNFETTITGKPQP